MKFGYTVIYVDDVEATIAFYEKAFGQKRGMVAGDSPGIEESLRVLSRGWRRLPCCAELAA